MDSQNDSGPSGATELPRGEPLDGRADDEVLVARLKAGDDDAYREVLQRHGGRLRAVALRMMRHDEEANDCVQDALLSAFRGIDRFEGGSMLSTWLHRIVVNACLMRLRSKKRKPERMVDPQLPEFDDYGFRVGPTEMTPLSATELLERDEVRIRVRNAIDTLSEAYRTVLILRDIEDFDTAETARLLEISPGAVKVRLHRARLALREQIGSILER